MRSGAIIAVGDEVLSGEIVNRNGAELARRLQAQGVRTVFQATVGDDVPAIQGAIDLARARADLVVVSGGLGPTHDDRTTEAVASMLGESLRLDGATYARLTARPGARPGREASIRKQSTVVESATVWANPVGTAPAQLIHCEPNWIVLLPGPPRELAALAETWLQPWLREIRGEAERYRRDTLVSYAQGESEVFRELGQVCYGLHPRVGLYARPGVVEIRLEGPEDVGTASLNNLRAAAWMRARTQSRLYRGLDGGKNRETVLIEALRDRGARLAAIESLTGGLVTARLTEVPGASECVRGGIVAYTKEAKIEAGVAPAVIAAHGEVSAETAKAMSRAARSRFSAEFGLATTGFAGPGGGTAADPVGTFYVAVDNGEEVRVKRRQIVSDRAGVRQAVVELSLTALWEALELGW